MFERSGFERFPQTRRPAGETAFHRSVRSPPLFPTRENVGKRREKTILIKPAFTGIFPNTHTLHPFRRDGEPMSRTRREFMKDAAVAGAAVAIGSAAVDARGEDVCADGGGCGGDRCPYFDQPMYCKGLSRNGGPLCDE